jgi:hypothetical protein
MDNLELTPEEQQLLAADQRADKMVGLYGCGIIACLFAAVAVIALQCLLWLKIGDWPSWSLQTALRAAGIAPGEFSWVGLQRVFGWLLALPVSLVLIICGCAISLWATLDDNKPVPEALRSARMKQARLLSQQRRTE